MAALSPFALSVLSVEQAMDRDHRRSGNGPEHYLPLQPGRHHRTTRRVTSNHNTFQTVCTPDFEPPPSYAYTSRQRFVQPRQSGRERLPKYSCTVSMEAKVLLNLESINPLHTVSQSDWREVYIEVAGTMLSIYRCKDSTKNKLLRTYTLQHAEVGLATDATHTVYHPLTRLAHLIPSPARAKAHKKDPRLFEAQKQHILRLRVETDQMLFAQPTREVVYDLVHAISAAIDISPPIDDRSVARQCTIPRRRRRDRAAPNALPGDFTDPAFIAEQERILRSMYPSLLGDDRSNPASPTQEGTQMLEQLQETTVQVTEEDEIDVSAMREERMQNIEENSPIHGQARPPMSRTSTGSSQDLALADLVHTSDPANFTPEGKWLPRSTRTTAQELRYAQRCMPVLLAEAVRASDIVIFNGHRVKINWRTDTLDDWELRPPSYRSHHFKRLRVAALQRSSSSASTITDQHASDAQASTDEITPITSTTTTLDLTKVISPIGSVDKALTQDRPRDALHKANTNDANSISALSGVVYCF